VTALAAAVLCMCGMPGSRKLDVAILLGRQHALYFISFLFRTFCLSIFACNILSHSFVQKFVHNL